MTTLAIYRQDIRGILGTHVDASTWSHEMIDDGIRQALQQFSDEYFPQETDFAVTTTGRSQDLSSITDIREVVAIAWPWYDDESFHSYVNAWRRIGEQVIYIEDLCGYPSAGEVIRVRYTKTYQLNGLDEYVSSTSVPTTMQRTVELGAAGHAAMIRLRQLSENPAVPDAAYEGLKGVAEMLLAQFSEKLARLNQGTNPVWSNIGL